MTTYIDTSALVPVYIPEQFSVAARTAVRDAGQIPFTSLHRLELSNAFELLVGRHLLTKDEHGAVHRQLREDLDHQRLVPLSLDCDQVFADAMELSRLHTATFLTRSLDLLHVAAARAALCQTFVSADDRQLKVAKATGLRVIDIKHTIRRRSR